eukprot:1161889-Pelagomonas_calceolata.AAC.2
MFLRVPHISAPACIREAEGRGMLQTTTQDTPAQVPLLDAPHISAPVCTHERGRKSAFQNTKQRRSFNND